MGAPRKDTVQSFVKHQETINFGVTVDRETGLMTGECSCGATGHATHQMASLVRGWVAHVEALHPEFTHPFESEATP